MKDARVASPAYERNKGPILNVLQELWDDASGLKVLEVASGPGQHVCHFAKHFEGFIWQPTDASEVLCRSIDGWREHEGLDAVLPAHRLDVLDPQSWPKGPFGGALVINFFHMVALETVERTLQGIGGILKPGGLLVVYDCFTYKGHHVNDSNAVFDAWLRRETPGGVHEFTVVDELASESGLVEPRVHRLPANNQCVVWTRAVRA